VQKERRRNDAAAHTPIQGIWSTAPGIRLPPRLAPQDQYAEGILSLSEKQPDLVGLLWRNSNESGRWRGDIGFPQPGDSKLQADTAHPRACTPVEDGSLNV
jgi:hypothetical protein